jgi:hypothetical protein
MAQDDNTDVQAQPPAEQQQELAGYTALPNLLLQELGGHNGSTYSVVLFIARHTIGRQIKIGPSFYRVKTVCLSFDEFLHGRRKRDGTRMQPPAGLPDDKAVMRGCQAALAHRLIEVGEDTGTRGVRLYSIPARFWLSAGFSTAIQMLADPRVPRSFDAYRLMTLDEGHGPTAGIIPAVNETNPSLTAGIIPADRANSSLVAASTAGKMPADVPPQHLSDATAPASTAGKIAAVGGQNASSTAVKMPADPSGQPAQEAAPGERKHSNKHRKVNIDRSFDTTESQNETQKEEQHTRAIFLPSVSTTPTEYSQVQPRVPATITFAEDAARYQRLFALQQELALLKKTPSMQLLARQRIPRLEAEMKQLLATLQASV